MRYKNGFFKGLLKRVFLVSQLNWKKSKKISCAPPAPTHAWTASWSTHHQSGTFLTIDESTLTHNHPKFIVYIIIHSWSYIVYGLDKCIVIRMKHSSIIQCIFTVLKSSVFCLFISLAHRFTPFQTGFFHLVECI